MVITCYDETEVDARAVNLTNNVGTITIVPVNFSYPSGSFRVESDKVFTHFTASITAAAGERVFKITGFTAINAQVVEYYYELDYLKDYWKRYSVGGSLIIPHTLLISEFSTTRPFEYNYPLDTKVTGMVNNISLLEGNTVDHSAPVMIMKSGIGVVPTSDTSIVPSRFSVRNSSDNAINTSGIYMVDSVNRLPYLWKEIVANTTHMIDNIEKTFYIPCLVNDISSGLASVAQKNDFYYMTDAGVQASYTFTGADITNHIWHLVLDKSNGLVEYNFNTGIKINIEDANDLPPYKKYKLYIPYIGWYEIPLSDIIMQNYGMDLYIIIKYIIDLGNGLISARVCISRYATGGVVYGNSLYQTPFISLPTYNVPVSDFAAETQMNQVRKNNSDLTNAVNSLGALMPALINPAMAVPAIAGAAVNYVNSSINNNTAFQQSQVSASLGNFTSGTDSAVGQIDRQAKLFIAEYYTSLTRNEAAVLTGYPVNQYIGGITPVQNEKYWMDFSSTQITGPEWYVNGVKNEYSKEYITLAS